MLGIGGFGFQVVKVVFLSLVCGIIFVLVVFKLVGRVHCGVGKMFQSIPFLLSWPSKIGWVLEIG